MAFSIPIRPCTTFPHFFSLLHELWIVYSSFWMENKPDILCELSARARREKLLWNSIKRTITYAISSNFEFRAYAERSAAGFGFLDGLQNTLGISLKVKGPLIQGAILQSVLNYPAKKVGRMQTKLPRSRDDPYFTFYSGNWRLEMQMIMLDNLEWRQYVILGES